MDLLEALDDDVSLEAFFTEWAPRLFAARQDDFARSSDIDFIICFKFQDTDEVYSVHLRPDGCEVEDDEMIDFPMVSVVGQSQFWPRVRKALRPIARSLEARREAVRDSFRLTDAFRADWEKFDVVIDVEVTDSGSPEPVTFSVVLNDYEEPDRARRFGFRLDLSDLESMADGSRTPDSVARSLKISGDYKIAATLGGMIMSHAPDRS